MINVSAELKTGITSTGSPTSSCCCPNWGTEKNKNESYQNSEAATGAFHGCFSVWRSWVNETAYDTKNSGGVYNPWSTDKTLLYSAADGSQRLVRQESQQWPAIDHPKIRQSSCHRESWMLRQRRHPSQSWHGIGLRSSAPMGLKFIVAYDLAELLSGLSGTWGQPTF